MQVRFICSAVGINHVNNAVTITTKLVTCYACSYILHLVVSATWNYRDIQKKCRQIGNYHNSKFDIFFVQTY